MTHRLGKRIGVFTSKTLLFVVALCTCAPCIAVELTKATVDAFDRYIAATEAKLEPRFRGDHFLWADESPEWRQRLRRGTLIVQPTEPTSIIAIRGGLIQDWVGAVFIPDASLRSTLSVVQDYGHHREIYKPEIADAKILSRAGDDFQVYMRIVKAKLLLSDVLNTEHEIRFTAVDSHRVFSRASSRRIAEVSNAGKPGEHELAVGQDRGFLWRIYGYWFFEESDGGVYVTCQSITLTRDLPFALGTVLGPILRELPGDSLRNSLEQTKKAVIAISRTTVP
ncbi:MAG TPA: hypothetical protein VK752_25610 [Bryobacteraceae bacterium]|jgi:hypothetical protein|nr:hypothetical protein [Bryobacteraceae bacterium]